MHLLHINHLQRLRDEQDQERSSKRVSDHLGDLHYEGIYIQLQKVKVKKRALNYESRALG